MQEVTARAAKESRRFALVKRAPDKDRQAGGDGAADGRRRAMRSSIRRNAGARVRPVVRKPNSGQFGKYRWGWPHFD